MSGVFCFSGSGSHNAATIVGVIVSVVVLLIAVLIVSKFWKAGKVFNFIV